jgi:hypothetical protein
MLQILKSEFFDEDRTSQHEKGIIYFVSDNVTNFIEDTGSNLLRESIHAIGEFQGNPGNADLIFNIIKTSRLKAVFEPANPIALTIQEIPFYLIISESGGFYLLEFEPALSSFDVDIQRGDRRDIKT